MFKGIFERHCENDTSLFVEGEAYILKSGDVEMPRVGDEFWEDPDAVRKGFLHVWRDRHSFPLGDRFLEELLETLSPEETASLLVSLSTGGVGPTTTRE